MISLFMVLPSMHVWIASLEFLTDALRLTWFLTLKNIILWSMKVCIVIGHLVSSRFIKVDKAKINVITSLPYPAFVREVRSCLGHVGFYKRFIQDLSKFVLPLSKLLRKDVDFVLDQFCREAFEELRRRLTTSPIMQPPDWELPFELMCDIH